MGSPSNFCTIYKNSPWVTFSENPDRLHYAAGRKEARQGIHRRIRRDVDCLRSSKTSVFQTNNAVTKTGGEGRNTRSAATKIQMYIPPVARQGMKPSPDNRGREISILLHHPRVFHFPCDAQLGKVCFADVENFFSRGVTLGVHNIGRCTRL